MQTETILNEILVERLTQQFNEVTQARFDAKVMEMNNNLLQQEITRLQGQSEQDRAVIAELNVQITALRKEIRDLLPPEIETQ